MKEITRITTIQIAEIIEDSDKGIDYMTSEDGKAKYAENLHHRLGIVLSADDVQVTNVQCFVREGQE